MAATLLKRVIGPMLRSVPSWDFSQQIPSGRQTAAHVSYNASGGMYWKPANGVGPEQLLVGATALAFPKTWSPDGRFIPVNACLLRETAHSVGRRSKVCAHYLSFKPRRKRRRPAR